MESYTWISTDLNLFIGVGNLLHTDEGSELLDQFLKIRWL